MRRQKRILNEGLLKPEINRSLHKEMCMIIVVDVPNDQEVSLMNYHAVGFYTQGKILICDLRSLGKDDGAKLGGNRYHTSYAHDG